MGFLKVRPQVIAIKTTENIGSSMIPMMAGSAPDSGPGPVADNILTGKVKKKRSDLDTLKRLSKNVKGVGFG